MKKPITIGGMFEVTVEAESPDEAAKIVDERLHVAFDSIQVARDSSLSQQPIGFLPNNGTVN